MSSQIIHQSEFATVTRNPNGSIRGEKKGSPFSYVLDRSTVKKYKRGSFDNEPEVVKQETFSSSDKARSVFERAVGVKIN